MKHQKTPSQMQVAPRIVVHIVDNMFQMFIIYIIIIIIIICE